MISELFRKWFGLDPRHCAGCEILSAQLASSERERRELLVRLLDKDKPEPVPIQEQEIKPVGNEYIPWRIRQQMLEAADREKARLIKQKTQEMTSNVTNESIEKLERELEVGEQK